MTAARRQTGVSVPVGSRGGSVTVPNPRSNTAATPEAIRTFPLVPLPRSGSGSVSVNAPERRTSAPVSARPRERMTTSSVSASVRNRPVPIPVPHLTPAGRSVTNPVSVGTMSGSRDRPDSEPFSLARGASNPLPPPVWKYGVLKESEL